MPAVEGLKSREFKAWMQQDSGEDDPPPHVALFLGDRPYNCLKKEGRIRTWDVCKG